MVPWEWLQPGLHYLSLGKMSEACGSPGERVLAVMAHPAKIGLKRRFMRSERLPMSLSEKLRNLRRLGA